MGSLLMLFVMSVTGNLFLGTYNSTKKIVYWNNPNKTTYPLSSTLHLSSKIQNSSNCSGIILFIGEPRATYYPSRDLLDKVQHYQQNPNILGVLVFDQKLNPGYLSWFLGIPAYNIPIWVIGKNSIPSSILNTIGPEGLSIVLNGIDENEWERIDGGLIFWVVSLVLINVLSIIMSIFTLIVLWKKGKRLSIATLCIMAEIISSSVRISEIICEWYLQIKYCKYLESAIFPFLLGASGMLVFFWLDITSGTLYTGKFLDTMKIPAITFFTLLILNELILDLVNFYFELISARTAIYIIYALLAILIGTLYFVVAFKISKLLKSNSLTRRKKLSSINSKALVCGALLWSSSRTLWYLLTLCFSVLSIIQISIFFPSRVVSNTLSNTRASTTKPPNQPSLETINHGRLGTLRRKTARNDSRPSSPRMLAYFVSSIPHCLIEDYEGENLEAKGEQGEMAERKAGPF